MAGRSVDVPIASGETHDIAVFDLEHACRLAHRGERPAGAVLHDLVGRTAVLGVDGGHSLPSGGIRLSHRLERAPGYGMADDGRARSLLQETGAAEVIGVRVRDVDPLDVRR